MSSEELKKTTKALVTDVEKILKEHACIAGKYNLLKGAVIKFGEDASSENWSAIEEIIGVKFESKEE